MEVGGPTGSAFLPEMWPRVFFDGCTPDARAFASFPTPPCQSHAQLNSACDCQGRIRIAQRVRAAGGAAAAAQTQDHPWYYVSRERSGMMVTVSTGRIRLVVESYGSLGGGGRHFSGVHSRVPVLPLSGLC